MSRTRHNPAAFPVPNIATAPYGKREGQEGMTLLDYFAGQTIMGLLAKGEPPDTPEARPLSRIAYEQAEAMLKERETWERFKKQEE